MGKETGLIQISQEIRREIRSETEYFGSAVCCRAGAVAAIYILGDINWKLCVSIIPFFKEAMFPEQGLCTA